MIQPKTPKKIKGERKKRAAQRKAESARKKAISDEIIEYRGVYYIPQHLFYSHPEISELMKDIPWANIQIVKTCSIGKSDGGY
ncbi:MAG: hypothetical protein K2P87_07090 [Lachnospiraceae bacterium]|nr:hypothetical protein [Lachnospiraceae bacterium]